jgi:hypothetical protein
MSSLALSRPTETCVVPVVPWTTANTFSAAPCTQNPLPSPPNFDVPQHTVSPPRSPQKYRREPAI